MGELDARVKRRWTWSRSSASSLMVLQHSAYLGLPASMSEQMAGGSQRESTTPTPVTLEISRDERFWFGHCPWGACHNKAVQVPGYRELPV